MAIEMLVGLNVVDEAGYAAYRKAMMPILETLGGGFGCDFRIAEVLRSPTTAPINRVFTIHFPDEPTMTAFFADPDYLAAKGAHFEAAVSDTTIIASYAR